MTRAELRRFISRKFCGCGDPQSAAGGLMRLLEIWDDPNRAMYKELPALVPDDGCAWLLVYLIDSIGLLEHGSGCLASWLTPLGKGVMTALQRENVDGFEGLFADHCIHGYDLDGDDMKIHDCYKFEEENPGWDDRSKDADT